MKKTTVQLAYTLEAGRAERVIASSEGEVYTPERGWESAERVQVIPEPGRPVYERWADVPAAWIGAVPYWR